jgi:hypothetical protein
MGKEFQRKYMHPTRRKLVDMVLNGGEYNKDTTIGYDTGDRDKKRDIGEIWTDANGIEWEQRSYGKVQVSTLSETMAEVRNWLQKQNECKSESCTKTKFGYTDKKLIKKTGYCSNCLAEMEAPIRYAGLWDVYEKYKLSQNMISYGLDVVSQLKHALLEVKNEYEVVNENGSVEMWKMEKSVDDLKAEIQQTIDTSIEEIKGVVVVRDECWEILKDTDYELISMPILVEL